MIYESYYAVGLQLLVKFLFKFICFENQLLYYLIGHAVFPVMSFWFLYFIYTRYLNQSWALILSFLGVSYFKNVSMWNMVTDFISSPINFIHNSPIAIFELTRMPLPSISFLFFISLFYFSSRLKSLNLKSLIFYSILWSAQIYIYPMNWVAGIIFWFLYIGFNGYFCRKSIFEILKDYLIVLLCVLVISIPYIQIQLGIIVENNIFSEWMSKSNSILINQWGGLISYLLPLLLMLLVIKFRCSDYYELWYRFYPIFIFMLVELICLNIHFFLPVKESTMYLFSDRIGNYFCRFLYFVPILYFLSIPPKQFYHEHNLKKKLIQYFNTWFNYIQYIRYAFILMILGVVSIVLVMIHVRFAVFQLNSLSVDNFKSQILSNYTNFNPSFFERKTPFLKISEIATQFKMGGLEKNAFLMFMNPYGFSQDYNQKLGFIVTEKNLMNGFGYWMIFQTKRIDVQYHEQYIMILNQIWESV